MLRNVGEADATVHVFATSGQTSATFDLAPGAEDGLPPHPAPGPFEQHFQVTSLGGPATIEGIARYSDTFGTSGAAAAGYALQSPDVSAATFLRATVAGLDANPSAGLSLVLREPGAPFVYEPCAAGWKLYGAGHPGTDGVPQVVIDAPPAFDSPFDVHVGNSAGVSTAGVLVAGPSAAELDLGLGGTVLVLPAVTVGLPLPPDGLVLPAIFADGGTLPCGATLRFQVPEVDLGASGWVSFSRGMELTVGN